MDELFGEPEIRPVNPRQLFDRALYPKQGGEEVPRLGVPGEVHRLVNDAAGIVVVLRRARLNIEDRSKLTAK